MKDKIIMFVIGILVGAIIATGAFFIYSKSITCNTNNSQMQNPLGNPPSMPNGQNGENNEPPAKPEESNNQSSNN